MQKLKVKAAPGLRVPRYLEPRKYIEEEIVVEVENTPYYRRMISAGDLIEVKESAPVCAPQPEPEDAGPDDKPTARKGK